MRTINVLLLALSLVNAVLAAALAIIAFRGGAAGQGQLSRTLRIALGMVGVALLLTVGQRIGLLFVQLGVLAEASERVLISWFQLVVSVATTGLAIGGIWMLRRLTHRVGETEAVVQQLVAKLPSETLVSATDLTDRELDVLGVIASGRMSDQDIADELVISPHTAGTHVRNMLKKTGLHNRRELLLLGQHLLGDEARAGARRTGGAQQRSAF